MNEEPIGSPHEQEQLQEILLSYVEAAEAGTAPDRQTFTLAHPEFAEEIVEFLATYHDLRQLAASRRDHGARHPGSEGIRPAFLLKEREAQNKSCAILGGPTNAPHASDLGQLGDYRLLREIGRGGMGVVYEAEQISLRRRVALKVLPFAGGLDSRQLQRFQNEAEAAAHLHHSHIVPVFAVGSERGVHFYAMQHIEGQSLASLIAERVRDEAKSEKSAANDAGGNSTLKKLSTGLTQVATSISTHHSKRPYFRRIAAIGMQAAEALDYAHQRGVIHRDIKPANLLLDANGDIWITDFGLAQIQSQTGLTISGELVGTLRYVSPEQAMAKRGLIDHRTDIYSLGATLYELLTLQPVFGEKDRHALMHQIGFDEPSSLRAIDPAIPFELETIVLKALAKAPSERYASAQELADDLRRFLDDKPIQATRPSAADRCRKWMRRHPAAVAAAIMLLAFGLFASTVSTVLIAHEQSRTQKAYDDLAIEEKQTKEALAKLKIEENRTQKAYKELADEQSRTKVAYAAEERQRRLAEWDFAQAQRAIDLVVQFSEGELAHRRDQQDVRRRLLLTLLDYYEDFLAQHADDPDVQAGHDRVAELVTELSSLSGNTLLTIIREVDVQNELKLSDGQSKQIATFVNSQTKPANVKEKANRPVEPAGDIEKGLSDIFNSAQKERFQQIVLQVQNQGRYGFSEPKLVETLKLTTEQRGRIRDIQNEAHRAWADHIFTSKKITNPGEFWRGVQQRIMTVFETAQCQQWQKMIDAPIAVDFREGYPFDGKNIELPKKASPSFEFGAWRGAIVVMLHRGDHGGSGFGHKAFINTKQGYSWRGKEIPPTAFEIAVTAEPLSKSEMAHLVTKRDRAPTPSNDPQGWLVLFRSADPSIWNTESPDAKRFAIPVSRAPKNVRYLRLKRMDTGESQIISIRYADLDQAQRPAPDQDFVWNGTAQNAWGGRHLGIAATRSLR